MIRFFGGAVFRYLPEGSGGKEKLCGGNEDGYLADPKKKHPFDDLGFDVGSVLLGHETCGEVLLLRALGGSICPASRIERIFVVLIRSRS